MPTKRRSPPGKRVSPEQGSDTRDGFYSRDFQTQEAHDLAVMLSAGLTDEIAMLRVATRRVFSLASEVQDLDGAIEALRALGLAAARLAGLLRAQSELGGEEEGLFAVISQALKEAQQELRLIQ